MNKKLFLYLFRWQLSSPILAICTIFLPQFLPAGVSGSILATIIANLIGGLIFFKIDQRIFKFKSVNNDKQKDT